MKYQNLGNLGTALFDLEYSKPNYIKTLSGFNAYLPYYENYKNTEKIQSIYKRIIADSN